MREWAFMILLIVVFLVLPSIWALTYFSRTLGALGVLLALAAFVLALRWRRSDVAAIAGEFRDSSKWFKGAQGEYLVHKELARLPDEFIVFHDYHPRGPDGKRARWNVDHIVVGPAGVFVLDAKYHARPRVPAASKSVYSKRNVDQAQRNALDLKDLLKTWSNGALSGVFVVPIVVYTQDDARVDQLREGVVRVLPLRLLVGDIRRHTEAEMDLERSGRVALALFSQLPQDRRTLFQPEVDAYLRDSRTDLRTASRVSDATMGEQAIAPTVCPRCGGRLVRKTARKGDRIGKDFLACENFHTTGCKYGFNLD
jgi:hypothetical protein